MSPIEALKAKNTTDNKHKLLAFNEINEIITHSHQKTKL